MELGFWDSVVNAGWIEQLIMLILVGFSIVSWAIILYKWRALTKAKQECEAFLDLFWESKRLDAIYQKAQTMAASPLSHVFRAGYVELAKLKKRDDSDDDTRLGGLESVERSMRRAQMTETTELEGLVGFLATTGTSAPFIGLLGTVIGIMSSFQDIGLKGDASLATVAPGIGGALAATAFGLFAAIPAVIAYNALLGKIRLLGNEMESFSSDFLNIIKRHFL